MDSISSGGISTFGSLIVKSFGFSSFETILFNIPFGAIQIICIIGSGWLATRYQAKGLVIAAISVLPSVGTIIMLTVPREQKGVLLFGYYLVSIIVLQLPLKIVDVWLICDNAGLVSRCHHAPDLRLAGPEHGG